ncbi:CUB and sushi domain-containing protein 3 [Liparis tanakae]|uniref:CUB and sushi domain-containing protein 3 n=1 Tax=Liparis tanakae TaxID=230148 RepID=A0A4Z2ECV3_9TELE|nr:CUB and sushi domain-containing protein 3 [Liparis tanakae]
MPPPVTSSGSIFSLRLTSDFAVSAHGFKVAYEVTLVLEPSPGGGRQPRPPRRVRSLDCWIKVLRASTRLPVVLMSGEDSGLQDSHSLDSGRGLV